MMKIAVGLLCLTGLFLGTVSGHGMMMDPPSRNSMWRVGFDTPRNYNDMGLNCGGAYEQWEGNGGKCGLCGDSYTGQRLHEAGGAYAPVNRPVGACYSRDANTIPVNVRITAYHKGYFEFRLCENNDLYSDPGQACLDYGHLLTIAGSQGETRYSINGNKQDWYQFALDMPDVTCTQCILQWKYNTGNSYGCDDYECGIGFGAQEQFINCADIAILDDCSGAPTVDPQATTAPPMTNGPYTTNEPSATTTEGDSDDIDDDGNDGNDDDVTCVASEVYAGVPDMDEWCEVNCKHPEYPYCPETHCVCY